MSGGSLLRSSRSASLRVSSHSRPDQVVRPSVDFDAAAVDGDVANLLHSGQAAARFRVGQFGQGSFDDFAV